jgi:SAM-dependent methyltransferase
MDAKLLFGKVAQTLRQEGMSATLRKVSRHLTRSHLADDFDVRHGTDTGGIEPLWGFTIQSGNARFGVRYQPTSEQELSEAVNFLHEDLRALTFIDLGCGKGRTVLVASELGFKNVIGVEFASELAQIARANLAKMRIVNAVVIHADAADFHFPSSDFVLYLYNPFSREVMHKVVANLRESPARRIYVIYSDPKCAELLDSSGFLSLFGYTPGRNIPIWTTAK